MSLIEPFARRTTVCLRRNICWSLDLHKSSFLRGGPKAVREMRSSQGARPLCYTFSHLCRPAARSRGRGWEYLGQLNEAY